jgi:uncharacterized protein
MEVAGYIAAVLTGISLGLIGGGGSILTLPVMVYLFGLQPLLATSYSLFIVGSTSLVGVIDNLRRGLINFKAAFLFGATSIITVLFMRLFLIPRIPATFEIGKIIIEESVLTMLLFAILMVVASVGMIRNAKTKETVHQYPVYEKTRKVRPGRLLLYGIAIGLVTGLLGAGGGFLLIPVLVLFIGLPMKEAVGTSLFIIALNSLIGFSADIGHFSIDWLFLAMITFLSITGILIGGWLSKKISGEKLKKGFGWFLLIMALYIFFKEMPGF